MELKHEKLGIDAKLDEDFTQAQFEQYQGILIEQADEVKANSVIERAIVQAAIDAKILTGIDKPLAEMKPREVRWLTIKVRDFVNEQTEVPQD